MYPSDQILVPSTMAIPYFNEFQALETGEIVLYP